MAGDARALYSSIHSVKLRTNFVLGTATVAGISRSKQNSKNSCFRGTYLLVKKYKEK